MSVTLVPVIHNASAIGSLRAYLLTWYHLYLIRILFFYFMSFRKLIWCVRQKIVLHGYQAKETENTGSQPSLNLSLNSEFHTMETAVEENGKELNATKMEVAGFPPMIPDTSRLTCLFLFLFGHQVQYQWKKKRV